MTHSTDVNTLARWMAADFSNQQQAFDNPPLYAHIRVCMRPLPLDLLGGMGFYLEQAYDFSAQASLPSQGDEADPKRRPHRYRELHAERSRRILRGIP